MLLACPDDDLHVIRLKHFHEESIYDKVQQTIQDLFSDYEICYTEL